MNTTWEEGVDAGGAELVRGLYRSLELRDLARFGASLTDDVLLMGSDEAAPGPSGPGADEPWCQIAGRKAVLAFLSQQIERSGATLAPRVQCVFQHPSGRDLVFQESTVGEDVRSDCVLFEFRGVAVCRVVSMSPVANRSPR